MPLWIVIAVLFVDACVLISLVPVVIYLARTGRELKRERRIG